ncbi:MAG: IS21 family transposase [Mycobacteriaceae bacterium]
MEAHALRKQGWSISAIARHLDHDRKTIRAYLNGERVPEQRVRSVPMLMDRFVEYCRIRLADDPHVWASLLFDEITALGFTGSYASLTAAIRTQRLRPHCEACQASRGRDSSIIDHPAGQETQWDWLELPGPPAAWQVGGHAHLLVGALPYSSRWRAVLAEAEDFGQLIGGLDATTRRLGGVSADWRFDRMATVCYPASGKITAAFAGVAKHYGVAVKICPARHGNRKGVVEKANHSAAQRWWRTVPDGISVADAQAGIDALAVRMDTRTRVRDGRKVSVAQLAAGEHLRPAPLAPYPVDVIVERTVTAQALVPFAGNHYSVPPGMPGVRVQVAARLGTDTVRVITAGGATVAAHQRRPDGSGAIVRDEGHVIALEHAVLAAFSPARPCNRKTRRPLGDAAATEAARLRGEQQPGSEQAGQRVVIDLAAYAALVPPAAAGGRTTAASKTPSKTAKTLTTKEIR